jgi:hypothetical protein
MVNIDKQIKLKYEDILGAQTAAARSTLSYEEGWNMLAAYFVAVMGEDEAAEFILSLEAQHNELYS